MSRRSGFLWALVGAIVLLLVLTGHGPHAVGYLPFLVLFACPLMHMFMRRGHHDHRADRPS